MAVARRRQRSLRNKGGIVVRTTVFLGISMVEQKNRRWLVATMYLILLAAIMAAVLTRSHLPGRYVSLVLQLFLVPLFLEWKIFRDLIGEMVLEGRRAKPISLGLSTKRDQDAPDERDVSVRNAAYFKAYRVLAWYSVLASYVAFPLWGSPYAGMLIGLVFILLVIATTLPQAILLWTEPDVPVEVAL